ncbi:MAG: hypothetical protein HYR58_01815 [Acidobacteria bacterium]|nr:hypothetical protein [Acidobacteriota bacterium]MBI3483590.1 hypothetical protein [Acidobacteriota bacterium]
MSNLKFLWWWLRQVSGDAAYENYLRSTRRAAEAVQNAACHPACPERSRGERSEGSLLAATPVRILSREEFFLDSLRRRYSTISRCC